MKITYYYNPEKPLEKPHNNPEFGEPSPLKTIELKEILANCFNIPVGTVKHGAGQIYAFIADKFYRTEQIKEYIICTDGALFDDVDDLNEGDNDKILDSFNELCKIIPNLTTIWKSHSGNLHVCFWTESLNYEEYREQELTSLLYLAVAVRKICGITLTDLSYGEKPNIDTHNSSISQRFFLNRIDKSSVRYNDDAEPANFKKLTTDELNELRKTWPYLVNSLERKSEDKTYINEKVNYVINTDKYYSSDDQIDYIPHRTRWNVYTCIANIIKDEQLTFEIWKSFVQRIKPEKHSTEFFINEPIKNRWWNERHPYPIYDLLKKYNFNIKYVAEDEHCIKKGEWITKYKDEIIQFIKDNKRTEIVAPTGTGKTSFINGKPIDNDSIFTDEFSLAKELNAVVIVPFNVTNKLYNSMIEISSENNIDEIRDDKSYVMVWDQALIHWNKIKYRTLIIDEAHCLFLDRSYRDVAVKLMNKIKQDNCNVVLFTATPSGEAEELDCKTIRFTNERNVIHLNFMKVNSVDRALLGCINYCLDNNKFDRIVLFDDLNAKKIYENLMIEGKYINDIAYIRADTRDSDDFKYLRYNELLNKKLTICTCVAFNGLNFKNDNENILVLTSYIEGETTAAKIIQESGRIRKSNVNVIVYYDGKHYESTLEDRIDKANVYQSAVISLGMPDSLLSYDRRLTKSDIVDALRKIEQHLIEESVKDVIINHLIDTGYFIVNDKDLSNDEYERGNKLQLAIKRKQSKEFIDDLMSGSNNNYKEGTYKDKWKKKIEKIISNDGYIGIDIDIFKEIIDLKHNNCMIDTIIDNVEKIIKISLLSDYEWKTYVSKIELIKEALKRDIDKRDLGKTFKNNVAIRKKYEGKVKEASIIDLHPIFIDLFDELSQSKNALSKQNSDNGKKGTKKVRYVETGEIFDSLDDAAHHFKKSNATMSKWLKQNKLIQLI